MCLLAINYTNSSVGSIGGSSYTPYIGTYLAMPDYYRAHIHAYMYKSAILRVCKQSTQFFQL